MLKHETIMLAGAIALAIFSIGLAFNEVRHNAFQSSPWH